MSKARKASKTAPAQSPAPTTTIAYGLERLYLDQNRDWVIDAIPAVLAYNFFVRLNRVTNNKFDTFAHDLHDFFATGSRVGETTGKR